MTPTVPAPSHVMGKRSPAVVRVLAGGTPDGFVADALVWSGHPEVSVALPC
jgi:hypothetical protein